MKQLVITFLVLLFFSSISLAQPELEIVNEKFFFGSMPQHSTVSHYFWFKSIGTDTLVINEIKTGCVCAHMPLETDRLAPGDSMRVGITWDIKNSLYKTGRYPYIFTNAKDEAYRIFLTGTALRSLDSLYPLSSKPYKFELNKIKNKSIDEIEFTLTNTSDEDIVLLVVSPPQEYVDIEIPEKIKANSSYKSRIKVKRDFLDKEFISSITIDVVGMADKRITLPIRRKFY